MKVMVVIAGPNGAGKTTLHGTKAELADMPFVNADEIAKVRFSTIGALETAAAQMAAIEEIDSYLRSGQSFCFETVFSHPSKLDLITRAQKSGFAVNLYIVVNDNPDVNVARVKNRVAAGGHDVPEDRIRQRRPRTLENLKLAVRMVERFRIIDTSTGGERELARKEDGQPVQIMSGKIPLWADEILGDLPRKTRDAQQGQQVGYSAKPEKCNAPTKKVLFSHLHKKLSLL